MGFVHVRYHGRMVDKLYVACEKASLHRIITNHFQLETIWLPQSIHQLKELEHKVVLSQIISTFEKEFDLLSFF